MSRLRGVHSCYLHPGRWCPECQEEQDWREEVLRIRRKRAVLVGVVAVILGLVVLGQVLR